MTGVEFDFVVTDSQAAAAFYQSVFGQAVEILQLTDYERGLNEAIFNLFGTRFHLLDENPDYGLKAPREGSDQSVWVNLMVEDLEGIWQKAISGGAIQIQEVTAIEELGIMNASFQDPFGHVWLIHQITDAAAASDEVARQAFLDEQFGPEGAGDKDRS